MRSQLGRKVRILTAQRQKLVPWPNEDFIAASPDPSISSQRIKEPLFSLVVMLGRHVGKEAASEMAYGLGNGGEK